MIWILLNRNKLERSSTSKILTSLKCVSEVVPVESNYSFKSKYLTLDWVESACL
jgi:hypothetical protein